MWFVIIFTIRMCSTRMVVMTYRCKKKLARSMLTKPDIHVLVWNGVCQGNDCGRNSNFEGAGRYFFGIQLLNSD